MRKRNPVLSERYYISLCVGVRENRVRLGDRALVPAPVLLHSGPVT